MKIDIWDKAFLYLQEKYNLEDFIETGVGFGDNLAKFHPVFKKVVSFEINPEQVDLVRTKYKNVLNVQIFQGDSGTQLPRYLRLTEDCPTLFFLDAHGIPGVDDGPLTAELNAIFEHRPNALIAIDDVNQGTHHDANLTKQRQEGVDFSGYQFELKFNRILFLHRGQYDLSELA